LPSRFFDLIVDAVMRLTHLLLSSSIRRDYSLCNMCEQNEVFGWFVSLPPAHGMQIFFFLQTLLFFRIFGLILLDALFAITQEVS
jgi:hypothetical protein